jgi:two-component system, OmpR family, sensor kinase
MRLRLHVRLTLAFGLLLVVLTAVLSSWIARTAERYHAEVTQRLNSGVAMYVTSELALLDARGINRSALDELARRVMTVNPSADVYLLAPDGTVLTSLQPDERIVNRSVRLGPVRTFLNDPQRRPILGDDPSNAGRGVVFSVAPVERDGRSLGYLYVVLGSDRFDSVVAAVRGSYTLKVGLVTAGVVALATLLVGAGLFAALTLPLRQLAQRMRRWRLQHGGAAEDGGDVESPDEIRQLQAQFDTMARQIEAQFEELRRSESRRRELIANVSHDLRTPLASLHGYLETVLLKGDNLDRALQRSYLEVACRHARHLERLIAALFELSKLETGRIVPSLEPFSVGELLQDVALRFRLRSEQLGVQLLTRVEPEAPLALGDVALVERVLENLVDNALRHTGQGGRVALELRVEPGHLRVSVVDNGSGICAGDLPHVFDRYFRGSDRRSGDRAGLGLAIVRRIVELHGESVTLSSTAGMGTCVEFGLPIAAAAGGVSHEGRVGHGLIAQAPTE